MKIRTQHDLPDPLIFQKIKAPCYITLRCLYTDLGRGLRSPNAFLVYSCIIPFIDNLNGSDGYF